MEFTNSFRIPLPVEDAWKLMLDIPRIIPCLPGAKLTGAISPATYLGAVTVKVGPIKLSFEGKAELVETDEANHIAWLKGSGLDPKGRGAAESQFSFALRPDGDATEVVVTTQLQLTGAVAQYGRGSGMISEVASHILAQFERNLEKSLSSPPALPDTPDQPFQALAQTTREQRPASAQQQATCFSAARDTPGSLEAQTVLYQAQALLGQAQSVLASTQSTLKKMQLMDDPRQQKVRKPPPELNMLSIGFKAISAQVRNSISGLFGRR